MAGGTDNNGRGHRQQSTKIVNDNKDKDNDDNNKHNEHNEDDDEDDKHDDKDDKYNEHKDDEHDGDDQDDDNHDDNDNDDNNDDDNNDDDGDDEDDEDGDDDGHNDSDSSSGWQQQQRWQQRGHSNYCRGRANDGPGRWRRRTRLRHHLGGLWVLVVVVVWWVVHAGCVCAARTCCSVRNHGILGIAGKLVTRRAKLLHLIKANL